MTRKSLFKAPYVGAFSILGYRCQIERRVRACCEFAVIGVGAALSTQTFAASDFLRLRLATALAETMTEIRYADREPEQEKITSRILFLGEKMRMDYGRDDQGYVLFDRAIKTVWHVSPQDQRLTGIRFAKIPKVWPPNWHLTQDAMPSENSVLSQVRVNGMLCVEYKHAAMLSKEATFIAEFRRNIAANQARLWIETPDALRQPCVLALDVQAAGVEYSQGLPLALRYWDGRNRVYQGHSMLAARPELFELPAHYLRVVLGVKDQETESRRQPRSSQVR